MMHAQTSSPWPFWRAVLSVIAAACLLGGAGCSTPPVPVRDENLKANPVRYLRYTLRGEPKGFHVDVYRSSYLSDEPMFKAGTRLKITLYSSTRIDFVVAGSECRMYAGDAPFATDPEGVQRVVEKYFAGTREELFLEGYEPDVRKRIDAGEVAIGMTKEAVFTALGYPIQVDDQAPAEQLERRRIFESSTWIYRYSEFPLVPITTKYWTLRFDDKDQLVDVVR